jgi:hypothetical protein
MTNNDRRKAARRRWYYKNRSSTRDPKPRVADVPLLTVEERREIRRSTIVFARAGKQIKSVELQRRKEARRCVVCNGPVLVRSMKAKSCSKACAKIARRKNWEDWNKGCSHCLKPCRGKNKYCDECNANRVYSRIQSTEEAKDTKAVRQFLLRNRKYQCESCKLSEWIGNPIPLELHHVDGNSGNNKEENLQLLCPNCHALTPTFRAKNRNASEIRRKIRRTKEFASLA